VATRKTEEVEEFVRPFGLHKETIRKHRVVHSLRHSHDEARKRIICRERVANPKAPLVS
jgi:hypothetical protein